MQLEREQIDQDSTIKTEKKTPPKRLKKLPAESTPAKSPSHNKRAKSDSYCTDGEKNSNLSIKKSKSSIKKGVSAEQTVVSTEQTVVSAEQTVDSTKRDETPRDETLRAATTPPSFLDFAQSVSYGFEQTPFHEVYYRLLEQFAKRRIKKLIVTMPPQHGKSLGATTLLPAYILGLNPDNRLAIASYSASLATKFNRRIQRIIESQEYANIFPETKIKSGTKPANYIRTSDEFDVIYHEGSLLSVGREGSLTGNRVDCFILDDLYKDAMEANSTLIRENCVEWYTSVVKTRMHNTSQEMMVFTRWHEEDLIGVLMEREQFEPFSSFEQIESLDSSTWLYLNFEAIKSTPPSLVDPRAIGEPLWPTQQSLDILLEKRALDPLRFECMYQGNPSSKDGLLYGENFAEYDLLPEDAIKRGNYTDTADMGDDYLCSMSYVVGSDHLIYITDVVYTREPMEISEPLVARMLCESGTLSAVVESNNGGRGFARAVQRLAPEVKVEWFHQSASKQARILTYSATVLHRVRFPTHWQQQWRELYSHLTTYRRSYSSNRWHDAADVITGIVEREQLHISSSRRRLSFI